MSLSMTFFSLLWDMHIKDTEPKTSVDKGSWSSVYMWLSGDPISPFHSNDQKLQDIRDLNFGHLSLDCSFSCTGGSPIPGCESILDEGSVFDGSQINPIDEARMVLNRTLEDIEGLQEAEVVSWLHESLEDDKLDSSIIFFESVESSYDPYLSEDSSVTKSFSTYTTTHEDSCVGQDLEYDRLDKWVSLLDLQEDDLELVQDKGQLSDVFRQPDFPSPTFRVNLLNHPCGPEWNGLCISPIKGPLKVENKNGFGARKPIRLKVLEKKGSLLDRRIGQEDARRNVCGSGPGIQKVFSSRVGTRSASTGQSRLSCLNPGGLTGQKAKKSTDTKTNWASQSHLVKASLPRSNEIQMPSGGSEESHEIVVRNLGQDEEVPIEKQIGLDEFDGHEGIANVEEDEGIQFDLE
ncbi:hypothetical protein H6P81_013205 [Aristolochia fimbriata]|uniref:Uncharacterized protein n=1 Tax=Aristolochia fimbriata TaxID=158543 RepID=A0AAV7EHB6_ARIFI|nr:hypothetical protein H6P81_013205 [Aristolochia fimbriata]